MTLVATDCTPFKQFRPLLMPMAAAALTAISRPKNRHQQFGPHMCDALMTMVSQPNDWHATSGVYLLMHQSLKKCYIGESKNLGERFRQHLTSVKIHQSSNHTNTKLHNQLQLHAMLDHRCVNNRRRQVGHQLPHRIKRSKERSSRSSTVKAGSRRTGR